MRSGYLAIGLLWLTIMALTFWFIQSSDAAAENSLAQVRCLKAYGYPDQFILLSTLPNYPSRIIEIWSYSKRGISVLFDNGYFVKRMPRRSSLSVVPAQVSPIKLARLFRRNVTPELIQTQFGVADRIEKAAFQGNEVLALRYLTPARGPQTFMFCNRHLIGLSAGGR